MNEVPDVVVWYRQYIHTYIHTYIQFRVILLTSLPFPPFFIENYNYAKHPFQLTHVAFVILSCLVFGFILFVCLFFLRYHRFRIFPHLRQFSGFFPAMCLKDWHYSNGKCYRYFSKPKTWLNAYYYCQGQFGAKLATIDNSVENK